MAGLTVGYKTAIKKKEDKENKTEKAKKEVGIDYRGGEKEIIPSKSEVKEKVKKSKKGGVKKNAHKKMSDIS